MNFNINFMPVLIAATFAMILGGVWYSPVLFGKAWMKLIGKSETEIKNSASIKSYGLTFLMAIITAWVLNYIISIAQADNFLSGVGVGFWVWIGFVLSSIVTNGLFEGRSFKLVLINGGYFLVSLTLTGGILASWS